jgi:hypothetical protein
MEVGKEAAVQHSWKRQAGRKLAYKLTGGQTATLNIRSGPPWTWPCPDGKPSGFARVPRSTWTA